MHSQKLLSILLGSLSWGLEGRIPAHIAQLWSGSWAFPRLESHREKAKGGPSLRGVGTSSELVPRSSGSWLRLVGTRGTQRHPVQGVQAVHTDVHCWCLFLTKPQENPLNPANVNSAFTLLGKKQICHRCPEGRLVAVRDAGSRWVRILALLRHSGPPQL